MTFLPGAAQSEDMRWQALTVSGMQGWGVKTHSTFDRETGEVTRTTEYRENGTQTSYAYSEDDQDRVISYHEADAKGETRPTYDKNGFVTERLEVKDRSKPNSSSNDEYIYTRKFRGGDVTEYAMYAYNTKNDPRSKEVYTYDDAGNALTVTFYAREKVLSEYKLTKASTYTMTYVWLDYAAAQIQEQQAQAEAQAEAERIEQANAAAYAQAEALLEEGNYEAAYDAFLQLGEYNDSHVRMLQVGDILNADIGKKILETMKTSLEAAYPMLEEVVYESTSLEQIRQLCETYYSVCGDFSFKLGWKIHSDFSWDGETLYWNYKTIKGNSGTPFGIGINNEWVYFFQKPVPVVDGKAVEQINTEQGIMAFNTERGKLEYELGYFKTDGSFKSLFKTGSSLWRAALGRWLFLTGITRWIG